MEKIILCALSNRDKQSSVSMTMLKMLHIQLGCNREQAKIKSLKTHITALRKLGILILNDGSGNYWISNDKQEVLSYIKHVEKDVEIKRIFEQKCQNLKSDDDILLARI